MDEVMQFFQSELGVVVAAFIGGIILVFLLRKAVFNFLVAAIAEGIKKYKENDVKSSRFKQMMGAYGYDVEDPQPEKKSAIEENGLDGMKLL